MAVDSCLQELIAYARSNSQSGFDNFSHALWVEVTSLGGGDEKKTKKAMPALRGWPLGKNVYEFVGVMYTLKCYDGCSRSWLLLRNADGKFYRFKHV